MSAISADTVVVVQLELVAAPLSDEELILLQVETGRYYTWHSLGMEVWKLIRRQVDDVPLVHEPSGKGGQPTPYRPTQHMPRGRGLVGWAYDHVGLLVAGLWRELFAALKVESRPWRRFPRIVAKRLLLPALMSWWPPGTLVPMRRRLWGRMVG